MSLGASTVTEAPTTTSAVRQLSNRCVAIMYRALDSNTDDIYIETSGRGTALAQDMRVRKGETIVVSVELPLIIKLLAGEAIDDNDFIRQYAFRSASGTQTLLVDFITL